ncbi:hypothetical protein OE749_00775 [Aestuariibacter sp. AA17]|uniref:Small integral membrane protein n=1 Tax=Fluctibacter corallii TaxID=2984329 RepID=A0ABT3A3I6_9ALTE|nr:hypothetical protein [Aestuariibacter sp. AA17]MCV2883226.1 hypothetical protein [Aestuariibacter sp. AA17]
MKEFNRPLAPKLKEDENAEPETLEQQFERLGAPPRSPATFLHIVLTFGVFNWLVPSSHEDYPILLFLLLVIVGSYVLTIKECNKLNQRIDVFKDMIDKDKDQAKQE